MQFSAWVHLCVTLSSTIPVFGLPPPCLTSSPFDPLWKNSVDTLVEWWHHFIMLPQQHVVVADVANSKRHQQLDEILIIFTHPIQENSKVVCKKTLIETRAFITSLSCMKCTYYSKRMLCKQDCVKFRGRIACQEFFWKQLCLLLRCSAGKKNQDFV